MQHSKRDNTWSKWGIFLGVAVALGALVVVGWTFMQNRFQPGSSLDAGVTIGIDDMPQSLDIRSDSSAAAERLLVDNVYETLVTVDQDNKLQPGLATSWKTSDDGLTVTLTLQSGVTFSNGHTLDASDAVWSLQQNVTNKVADVDELGDLASVANPNATTVVITLAKPNPTLLRALSGRLGIVYDSESSSADYQRKAIGSGPFTVADFQPGHSLKLARSDTYHGTKAASNVVEFMQYSDADALSKALTDGSLDMAAPVSASTATGLNGKDGLTVKEGATTDKVLLAYNNGTDSLLSDEQARKAFRYQIDAAGIASAQPDAAGALGGPISLLDTPGILWPKFDDQTIGMNLAFTGAVKDDIMDVETLACHLIQLLAQRWNELRASLFTPEHVEELLRKNAELLHWSGAYEREYALWGENDGVVTHVSNSGGKPSLRSALNLEETVDFIYERTEFLDEAMAQYTPPERYWNYWMEGLES